MNYDGIIVGAGHNALILAAYLGQAGFRVLAVDRAAAAGGGLATIEHPRQSGFLHNPHAFFQRAITAMPWYADLELERHGARYIEPELNVALLTRDGRALEWWTDIERTIGSVAQFSRRDADTLRRWHDEFVPIVAAILGPENRSPPLPPAGRRELLERSAAGRRLLEVSALSPLEFVQREFEDPTVMAGLLFFNGLREVDLRVRGFGHHIAALLASPAKAQMSRGGSAAVARALEAAMRASGGDIRLMTEPARIVVESGRAIGIETREGEMIAARHLVASSLNPHQTFLDLLDPSVVPGAIREQAEQFQYNLLAPLFALHLNLHEPPRYTAAAGHPELAQAFMTIVGLDHIDQFFDIIRHHEAGTIPPTVMWGACPTLFDSSQAPRGEAHRVHVGEAAVSARRGCGELGSGQQRARPRHAGSLAALRAEPARRGDRDLRSVAARHRAKPAEHARRRPARRRLQRGSGWLPPAVPGRGRVPHAYPEPLFVRIEQPSGGQRHGASGIQRRAGDSPRPRHRGRLDAAAACGTPCRNLSF